MRGSNVIEETDARVNVVLAGSVNVDLARDARLLGLARHRRSVFRRHAWWKRGETWIRVGLVG